ncbi:MAG: hypothetical protein JHC31_13450 [Sulfurihydrogenibium sp.]|jgi:hypothetical protein|nr:hypothetical protein [Sulfurihydrogenibium sp.]
MIVLNPEGFKELSKYSGNPFLDAMMDLHGLFQTLALYQQNKDYIEKYSDTNLSDLKDKIKAMIPDVVDEKGNINFNKLQELAGQGNDLAQSILEIKNHREAFANAPLTAKFEALKNPQITDLLSANILDKDLKVKQKIDTVQKIIKDANIPDEYKERLLPFAEKIAKDPQTLKVIIPLLISPINIDDTAFNTTTGSNNADTNKNK